MVKDDIVKALRMDAYLMYEGAKYRLLGFYTYKDRVENKIKHAAEMEDKNKRTIVRAPLDKVEIWNGEETVEVVKTPETRCVVCGAIIPEGRQVCWRCGNNG